MTIEYTNPVLLRQPERVVVPVGYPIGTDPPSIGEELQHRESVHTESVIHLPTGPLIESKRAKVVVYYNEKEQ